MQPQIHILKGETHYVAHICNAMLLCNAGVADVLMETEFRECFAVLTCLNVILQVLSDVMSSSICPFILKAQ